MLPKQGPWVQLPVVGKQRSQVLRSMAKKKKKKNSRGSSRQIVTIQSFTVCKAGRCTGLSTNPHLSGVWFPPCKVDITLPAFGDHLSIGKGNGCELPRRPPPQDLVLHARRLSPAVSLLLELLNFMWTLLLSSSPF